MTTTPNEPVRDEDIETSGLGSTTAPGTNATGDSTRDGAEGGPLDTQDESDADSSDGSDADSSDAGDADGTDGGDADGTDGGDADGTDA